MDTLQQQVERKVAFIVKNWDKVPDESKTDIRKSYFDGNRNDLKGLEGDEHKVILLLDRQKPSVEADYSFDMERIAITPSGKVVWGFDSGCSCPSPWHDSYPECYSCSEGWKEFEAKLSDFDVDALKEVDAGLDKLMAAIK